MNVTDRIYIPTGNIVTGTRFLHLGRVVEAAENVRRLGLRTGSVVLLTDGTVAALHSSKVALEVTA